MKSITVSRDCEIRKRGGYASFTENIPVFFAGVKTEDWWVKRPSTFDNIIGGGKKTKTNWETFSELGSSANTHTTPGTLSQPTKLPEHDDFFPPIDPRIALRPKVNDFKDDADRDRREAEAREFYRQQQEAA